MQNDSAVIRAYGARLGVKRHALSARIGSCNHAAERIDRGWRSGKLAVRLLSGEDPQYPDTGRRPHPARRVARHRRPRCWRGHVPVDPRRALADRHQRGALHPRNPGHLQAGHPLRRLGPAGGFAGPRSLLPSLQPAQFARRRTRSGPLLAARRGRRGHGICQCGDPAGRGRRCRPCAEASSGPRLRGADELRLPLRCHEGRRAARRGRSRTASTIGSPPSAM